jgi:O-acetyl-ADP-ribose deacetylase (regulator of RNase III)
MSRVETVRGNIVEQAVDAIVNAANASLLGGGGVDGAIHRAAGPDLLTECRTLGGCLTGHSKITAGYALPARYVIHTVGPFYRGGTHGEAQLLASAYRSSLELAEQHLCRTVAFPSISTGAYGFPVDRASAIAIRTVFGWLQNHELPEIVRFVLFSDQDLETYQQILSDSLAT